MLAPFYAFSAYLLVQPFTKTGVGGTYSNQNGTSAHRRTIRPRCSERHDWSKPPDLATTTRLMEPIRRQENEKKKHWGGGCLWMTSAVGTKMAQFVL